MPASLELCAGAGGQALGLEEAGFEHVALVENDKHACATLRLNRPSWHVLEQDAFNFSASPYRGVDLLAAGVPCPPFSKAGQKLGKEDERNLFPEVLRLVAECGPTAIMIENVPGLLESGFDEYRAWITQQFFVLGYIARWKRLNASHFGVPQLRPRVLCVALPPSKVWNFNWPMPHDDPPPTVGEALLAEMGRNGWRGAAEWAAKANTIAPTLVGGSKKHGGPDLGPTRARQKWAKMGVVGGSLAGEPPGPDFEGMPRLTVKMAAILQSFPTTWEFSGKKTPAYRQVGNAFPPPVAKAVAGAIRRALVADEVVYGAARTGS